MEFSLDLPQARSVTVAGTFNDWNLNRTPMRPDASGAWKAIVWLPAGRYEYRFVADGKWLSDPNGRESVQNAFGGTNSVLVVSGDAEGVAGKGTAAHQGGPGRR